MTSPFDNPTPPAETPAPAAEAPRQESPDELTLLKQRAQLMGIQVPPNIKAETLKARIQEKVETDKRADAARAQQAQAAEVLPGQPQAQSLPPQAAEQSSVPRAKTKQDLARKLKAEYLALVRVKVTCLDPSKAELKGEIITVANGVLGKVSKYVPYGDECGEDGYHIPKFLYLYLKEKRFYQVKKDKRDTPIRSVEMPEYAIEVLPKLTAAQLAALAQRQKAAAGTTSSSGGASPGEE